MKQARTFLLTTVLIGSFLGAVGCFAADKTAPKVFYRYVNEQGVKVVAQTIPPSAVRGGYEMVSISGEVLKVVPPSPSEKDAERMAEEKLKAREQAKSDLQLRRSYSSIKEIEAAKVRNLGDLRSNIDLLKANTLSVKAQLKTQESNAAARERTGQAIPEDLLKNITNLRAEEKEIQIQIEQREKEFQEISDRYDQDKKRFLEINPNASK